MSELEYDPFGEKLVLQGQKDCPIGYSSKYTDFESNLTYFGYRFYSGLTGRWLSTDSLQEKGGTNLYAMVKNDPINKYDYLGLSAFVLPNYQGDYSIKICVGVSGKSAGDLAEETYKILKKFEPYFDSPRSNNSIVVVDSDIAKFRPKNIPVPSAGVSLIKYGRPATYVATCCPRFRKEHMGTI